MVDTEMNPGRRVGERKKSWGTEDKSGSAGKCDVKYDQLKTESEAKASIKRMRALKILYFSAVLFVLSFIIFIDMQLDSKTSNAKIKAPNSKPVIQKNKSEDSDLPNLLPISDLPFLQTPHVDHTSTSPPAPIACGVQVKDDPVNKVGSLNTYVTGSYMDHRFAEKQIKTIAIILREEQVKYSCVMCCEGRNVTSPAEYTIHRDHFDFEYGTATITCHINSSCLTPTHVAITAREISDSITSFLPVKNRDVPTVFPYEFAICISVMYDYKNVLNLVQSMEMFRLLGAQRVTIYKTNCDSDTQKVLDYYVKRGFVEIIPWTIKKHINVSRGWRKEVSSGQLHYYGQIPALNDCIYRYMYQSYYVALQDLDELILPLKVKTWTELLPDLEKIYGTTMGFLFESNAFPLTTKAHKNYEQDKWKNVRGRNILNYIERVPNNPNAFKSYKTIVSPRLPLKTTVHGLLETVNRGPTTLRVNNSIARMYHYKYFTCPKNISLIRDEHLWDYAKDLIPAVSKVLQDCGFIEA